MQGRLDKLNKALDRLQTIFAVSALICLVVGYYYSTQVYTYLSQAPEPQTTTLTLTVASTSSTTSTCTIHPCSYTVTISQPITIEEGLSVNVTHMAAQRKAQEAWYLKTLLDDFGTALLVAYLVVSGFQFVARRYPRNRDKTSEEKLPNATSMRPRSESSTVNFHGLLPT
jgi:hypothetical protein